MRIIFKAKTHQGYTMKMLAELLQNNSKTGCFEVDETGITLRMMDQHRTVLIDLHLSSENFMIYKFKAKQKLYLGINLNHYHKMLKSIKKKDSMQLFVTEENPNDLGIKVIPKENNRVTTSFITIQQIQNIDIDLPTGYEKPVIVPSNEFQKLIKDMAHIGSTVNIISRSFYINFRCNAGGIMKRHVEFGELDDSDDDEDEKDTGEEYNQDFDTDQLARITKMAGLSSNMQVYPRDGLPLLFRSPVGDLGKISVYIKSKDQITNDKCSLESDTDDE